MNNSECSNEYQWSSGSFRFLVSAVVYGFVLAVGLPLNAVSLWILLRQHGLRSPGAVLMINLAASDLLLALSLPLRVYFYATLKWPFGASACTVAILLFRVNIRMSSIFITIISVDRLLALVFPLRSRSLRTSSFACKCCSLMWILITILCIPEGINVHRALKSCHYMSCFEMHGLTKVPMSTKIGQAIFFLTLLMVNFVSTVMVIVVLRKRPGGDATKVNNKMSVVLIFVVNMLFFIVFFLPFTIYILAFGENCDGEVFHALICLASVNCCLDPLIYYFSLDSFWQVKGKNQTEAVSYSHSRSQERL